MKLSSASLTSRWIFAGLLSTCFQGVLCSMIEEVQAPTPATYAIRLAGCEELSQEERNMNVDKMARLLGMRNLGTVGDLECYYQLESRNIDGEGALKADTTMFTNFLAVNKGSNGASPKIDGTSSKSGPKIDWFEGQEKRQMQLRSKIIEGCEEADEDGDIQSSIDYHPVETHRPVLQGEITDKVNHFLKSIELWRNQYSDQADLSALDQVYENSPENNNPVTRTVYNLRHNELVYEEPSEKTEARQLAYNDPLFKTQFYHEHLKSARAWDYIDSMPQVAASNIKPSADTDIIQKINGRVTVGIVDDGVSWQHADIEDGYIRELSYDINRNVSDAMPKSIRDGHGTSCAGLVVGKANNGICGVGVAHKHAVVAGIRLVGESVTDAEEAIGLQYAMKHMQIYSNSWGPTDDGKTIGGPKTLLRRVLEQGVQRGRDGKGVIYLWASGNGGASYDNCNYDGYTNSPYTIAISAIDHQGNIPSYSEVCAAALASTFSGGSDHNAKLISTTHWMHDKKEQNKKMCTSRFSGTSAACPIAAGVYAMALKAYPHLTWRDAQELTVRSALSMQPVMDNLPAATTNGGRILAANGWQRNGAGFWFHHKYGFGRLEALKMLEVAATLEPRRDRVSLNSPIMPVNRFLNASTGIYVGFRVTEEMLDKLDTVEHVEVHVGVNTLAKSVDYLPRGDLTVTLVSPSGMTSLLATRRYKDDFKGLELLNWSFTSVANWGESPLGLWVLHVAHESKAPEHQPKLTSWQMKIHGNAKK